MKVHHNPDHTTHIRVNDDYVVVMRYPTSEETFALIEMKMKRAELAKKLSETHDPKERGDLELEITKLNDVSIEYDIMVRCFDKLVGDDEVYNFSESTPQEINDFVESLDTRAIKRIQTFFETMPVIDDLFSC